MNKIEVISKLILFLNQTGDSVGFVAGVDKDGFHVCIEGSDGWRKQCRTIK